MELQNRTESAPTRKHSTGCAQTTPSVFGRLTKAELITLLEGRALRPLTDAEFTRGAVSLVLAWCGRAVRGEYASLVDLTGDLQSLLKIYQSYKS